MNELALFAGAGGGILGGKLLGWRTVCAVERDAYAASVLLARQNDGFLAPFPIWDDVCTFDGRPWRGRVDVVSGGFPCQDISAAGKGAGITGERSGLWLEMARIISEVRPRYAFVENSPMLTVRGLGVVLGDLAALGFDARWGVLGAADVGAPHLRARLWIVADDQSTRRREGRAGRSNSGGEREPQQPLQTVANTASARPLPGAHPGVHRSQEGAGAWDEQSQRQSWWAVEPDVGRVAHGVAARVDRVRALGNGQVPACAAEAWRALSI
ncbi:DNA cytosine methyltransferase [uncultured Thiodictyon sp.]|uniref:DNA cytosine methyltransferase n=1 Tax=uncultured Thiodictyon sp. TaxID=1846217 RepID=UPI00343F9297